MNNISYFKLGIFLAFHLCSFSDLVLENYLKLMYSTLQAPFTCENIYIAVSKYYDTQSSTLNSYNSRSQYEILNFGIFTFYIKLKTLLILSVIISKYHHKDPSISHKRASRVITRSHFIFTMDETSNEHHYLLGKLFTITCNRYEIVSDNIRNAL